MAMKKGIKQLLEEANKRIKTVSVDEAMKMHGRDDVVFVDIRDVREPQNPKTPFHYWSNLLIDEVKQM